MKPLIKKFNKELWLTFVILSAVLLGEVGCATTQSNPLQGWKILFSKDYERLDPAIKEDYQGYIANLPHREKMGLGRLHFLKTEQDSTLLRLRSLCMELIGRTFSFTTRKMSGLRSSNM